MVESSWGVQSIDKIDIVGVRKDGGVDTVIVCSGPLDSSPRGLWVLGTKVRNYLGDVAPEDFRKAYGIGPVRILLCCEHLVSDAPHDVIEALQAEAAAQDVQFQLIATVA